VELHAQLHLGSASYFDYYNQPQFTNDKDAVLYELLLDENLLEDADLIRHPNRPRRRRLRAGSEIQASPSDQAVAGQYGWTCQADAIDYKQPHFYHADLTRQECLRQLRLDDSHHGKQQQHDDRRRPLWQVVADRKQPLQLPGAAWEAATALLVGPPIFLSTPRSSISRRVFTNLFLPGDSLALWLRFSLWLSVPSPEISILLLDWSVLEEPKTASFSQVGWPVVAALAAGRLDQVRQLVFGQVILSGHHSIVTTASSGDESLMIAQRNDHALELLQDQLDRRSNEQEQRIALLYGCNHCPDLHSKLQERGFEPIKTEWRSAWSVELQQQHQPSTAGSSPSTNSTNRSLGLFFAVLLPLYLLLGGTDWIATLKDFSTALDQTDYLAAVGVLAFYLARHVLFYVGLSKLVLDVGDAKRAAP